MGLFNRRKKSEASSDVQYRLHIICIVEDWNQMQQRDFVAVDIEKREFYRIHEQLGAWMASYYYVKAIDMEELNRLYGMATKHSLKNESEFFDSWLSFSATLQDAEVVEITKGQLLHIRNA